jgi:hypothetical protein
MFLDLSISVSREFHSLAASVLRVTFALLSVVEGLRIAGSGKL